MEQEKLIFQQMITTYIDLMNNKLAITKAIHNAGFRRLATFRPASGFGTGDTDEAPQSRTAGMASTVGCNNERCLQSAYLVDWYEVF
jgi:hypothetical protein